MQELVHLLVLARALHLLPGFALLSCSFFAGLYAGFHLSYATTAITGVLTAILHGECEFYLILRDYASASKALET